MLPARLEDQPGEQQPQTGARRRFSLPGSLALKHRDFRPYGLGYVTEVSGLRITQGWQLYELSGAAVLLGAVGLGRALPATVLMFIGLAMADRLDQRKLLIAVPERAAVAPRHAHHVHRHRTSPAGPAESARRMS